MLVRLVTHDSQGKEPTLSIGTSTPSEPDRPPILRTPPTAATVRPLTVTLGVHLR